MEEREKVWPFCKNIEEKLGLGRKKGDLSGSILPIKEFIKKLRLK